MSHHQLLQVRCIWMVYGQLENIAVHIYSYEGSFNVEFLIFGFILHKLRLRSCFRGKSARTVTRPMLSSCVDGQVWDGWLLSLYCINPDIEFQILFTRYEVWIVSQYWLFFSILFIFFYTLITFLYFIIHIFFKHLIFSLTIYIYIYILHSQFFFK